MKGAALVNMSHQGGTDWRELRAVAAKSGAKTFAARFAAAVDPTGGSTSNELLAFADGKCTAARPGKTPGSTRSSAAHDFLRAAAELRLPPRERVKMTVGDLVATCYLPPANSFFIAATLRYA